MSSDFVVLGGIGYRVDVQDNQVIFTEQSPVFGTHTLIAFSKHGSVSDGVRTDSIWYLDEYRATNGSIPALHVVKAYEYCVERFGEAFKPFQDSKEPQ